MNFLLAVLVCLAVAPFLREALRRPVSASRRAAAPGQMATLSQGETYFQWRGPEDGPVAVCVHGLTTPSLVWDRVVDGLTEMGFRVLTYDLYGRGLSSRPPGSQDDAFFARQLDDLLAHEGVEGDITLLGYSMGGSIVPSYAADRTDRVRQLVLVAPGGLGHDLGPASRLIENSSLVGNWLMLTVYARSLRNACNAERETASSVPGINAVQLQQLRDRGFLPAVLSSLRGMLGYPMTDAHRSVAAAGLPVLAIWGAEDEIIPLAGKDMLAELNPAAQSVVIDGGGHNIPYTHDPEVVAALEAHLLR